MSFPDQILTQYSSLLAITHRYRLCQENGDQEAIRSKLDSEYFESYADITVHEEMLADKIRMGKYRYGILKNYESIRGKIVVDIGAGTGILSIFCVQAGAKKVYAVEASNMAEQTRKIIAENNMADRITVLQCKAEDAVFPEKVDVIVSEWMGYNLLYESMLPSVLCVRDKWLKEDGHIYPHLATLYMAPYMDEEFEERLDFWQEMRETYKVSMDSMAPYARKCITSNVSIRSAIPELIQAHKNIICTLDLKTVTEEDIKNIKSPFEFCCFGDAEIHGFVTWFDVSFPNSIRLSTSPYEEETHWAQTLFYIDTPLAVRQDDIVKGTISISPNKEKHRFLDINITYQVNDSSPLHKYIFMSDTIT